MATSTKKKDAGMMKSAQKKSGAKPKAETASKKGAGPEQKKTAPADKKKKNAEEPEVSRHGNALYSVEVEEDGTAKATAEKKKSAVPASQRVTVGSVVMDLLQDDPDVKFEQVLERVKAAKPDSRFDKKHFAWYRSKAKKERVA